ncbi:MAG TPA: tRNA (adenosine(37)-N6)-threonylcarbamoyltransferase complex dimerization subunit type 1 TsaB [Alloprevotella sp.]|nr:tRNA (adenosine(37)-N6)-threonylcarbamoyltransferase complex dimerization subunit type 1 TsaB [Alloprevotella sp.]
MSCILHIETSTDVCSVALSQDGMCLMSKEDRNGPSHASVLAPFVEEALSFADSHAIPLDAVAVSKGPGSYTGLRIGVSTAKGVCYGRNAQLIAIPTLELLCTPLLLYGEELPENALLCPMIDARRMEVYSALYDTGLSAVRETQADIVDANSYLEYLDQHPVFFFGNGADKCRSVLVHPNAHFIEDIYPSAKYMFPLAEQRIARMQYEDVAYFEPFYLKEFVTTLSKKSILPHRTQ